jgi:hypothetical protein
LGIYQFLKNNLKNINPDVIHVNGYHTLQSIEVIQTIKNINSTIPMIFSPYLDLEAGTLAGLPIQRRNNHRDRHNCLEKSI